MIATIDFETTGFKAGEDEILQVSIIDEEENTLLNVYCKPIHKTEWIEAERVNKITPLMVYNELPFERYVDTVRDILNRAEKVIAYNAEFENSFLQAYGIEVDKEKWIDPMLIFAEVYGQWDDYHGNYKWQNLSKCARYYGYEFKAHDSLEDVKATLFCYLKMTGAAVPSIPKLQKGAKVKIEERRKY
ncbi:3'-5' exonuclease [Bacteroides sp.]|uniref:3'-5' exonuclease n=1 Tax=Bacteroides sp. TaxID=29523 RepID=UPI0026178FE1|nr:3'-5' exonuclease [Bacteroides sp.]MDD3040538.1 3'-5' exonuclease [Bacteroides sp.]